MSNSLLSQVKQTRFHPPIVSFDDLLVCRAEDLLDGDRILICTSKVGRPGSPWCYDDQANAYAGAIVGGLDQPHAHGYTRVSLRVSHGAQFFLVERSSKKKLADFPHFCPRCGGSAYIGFNVRVEHAPGVQCRG